MSARALPVGELLDEFVGRLPAPRTPDRRIDRTARIVDAAIATVRAALALPLAEIRAEAATRLPDPQGMFDEPDLEVACSAALYAQIVDTLSDVGVPMGYGRCSTVWLLLAGAAQHLQTLTRLVTSSCTEPGGRLALASLRAQTRLLGRIAASLDLRSLEASSLTEEAAPADLGGGGVHFADRLIATVLEAADLDRQILPEHAFRRAASPDRVDYVQVWPITVAQARLALDLLEEGTVVLCDHLSDLYCDPRWATRGAEIADALHDVRARIWALPDTGMRE